MPKIRANTITVLKLVAAPATGNVESKIMPYPRGIKRARKPTNPSLLDLNCASDTSAENYLFFTTAAMTIIAATNIVLAMINLRSLKKLRSTKGSIRTLKFSTPVTVLIPLEIET